MSKLLIYDADSIVFTVAWKYRIKKSNNLVKLNVNKFISDVARNCDADDYIGFYGAKEGENLKPNFRYAIDPNYKANRPPTPDFVTKWRPTIHKEFKDNWGFLAVEGMEADDAVAIAVEKYRKNYDEIIVATFDKDLRQIPDITFYNMKNHKIDQISKFQATYNFYHQMLMGDAGDNIPGLKGIGKAGATKILKDCETEYSLFNTAVRKYKDIEDTAKEKELNNIIKRIKEELADVEIDTSESVYNGLSDAKLDRKIRINSKKELKSKLEEIVPGGWRAFYVKQHGLLRMLTEENEDIIIPDVQSNPVKVEKNEDSVENAVDDIVNENSIDSFLTI